MVLGIDLGGALGGVITFFLAVLAIMIVGGVIAAVVYYQVKVKKFKQYRATLFRVDSFGQVTQSIEGAGVFKDSKTKMRRLFFKHGGSKDCENIPFIYAGKVKCIYLLHTGGDNFKFVNPTFTKDDVKYELGAEDVNWAVHEYDKSVQILSKQSMWEKILPYAALALVSIIILFMFIFLFRKFDVIQGAAQSLSDAATTLKDIQTNMTMARII